MRARRNFARAASWLGLLAVAAWLLSPALSPVHVEGFSASIIALGLHFSQGTIPDFAPHAPLAADYFGLTKFGAVLGVATMSPLLGGEGAMRLLMHLGLVISLLSLVCLIRAWSGARWWIVVASLILVPGSVESAFYFNDNLPAASLLFAGLALLVCRPSLWAATLAGMLIGYAITIRIDTVLMAVMAVPLAAGLVADWRKACLLTVVSGAVGIVVVFALFAIAGATPLDALRAGMIQVEVWDRPVDLYRHALEFLYFLGLPGLVLGLLGTMQLVRARQWYLILLLLGLPVAINLIQLGTLWQARQFLVFAPFLCALVARGAQVAFDDFAAGRRVFPALVAAFLLFVLAGPIRGLAVSDGPHELFGRFGGIALWTDWQDQTRQDFRRIDQLIDMGPRDNHVPLILLPNYWNEDRYLHLRLVERGFRRVSLPAVCGLASEGFRKGHDLIIPFAATFASLKARQLKELVMPCATSFPSARLALLADSARARFLVGQVSSNRAMRPELANAGLGWLSVTTLDQHLLEKLTEGYRREALDSPGPRTLEEAYWISRSRTSFSR